MTGYAIANATAGEDSSVAWTEKIPVSGSKWMALSTLRDAINTYIGTLTNKNITPRNVAVTQAAAPAWNCDNGDIFTIDALAEAITSMTTNQTGTPVDRQEIDFEITDDGTARAITWGANFLGSTGTALPSTTVLGKTLYVKFRYNGSVWIALASTSAL